jgi:cephalosporin hydroxylase
MSEDINFENRNKIKIKSMGKDSALKRSSQNWFLKGYDYEYSYHFRWLGRPIIQYPQDMIALQEIIWDVKPDIIIETGIARGGSLIFSASILQLIGKGKIVGIDIDIREHNKKEIKKHPLYKRIKMIEGSSTDEKIIKKVFQSVKSTDKVLVILDSNHTHEHVLKELEAYSKLVTKSSYLIVFDTVIEDLPDKLFRKKPWSKKYNPKTAVRLFLSKNKRFKIDRTITDKLLITAAPEGYLKCIK